jgi:hypothetical protein
VIDHGSSIPSCSLPVFWSSAWLRLAWSSTVWSFIVWCLSEVLRSHLALLFLDYRLLLFLRFQLLRSRRPEHALSCKRTRLFDFFVAIESSAVVNAASRRLRLVSFLLSV